MTDTRATTTTLSPLIREFLRDQRAQGEYTADSARLVSRRLVTIDRHFGRRPIDQFTRKAIEAWMQSVEHLAPNSRAAYVSSVRVFSRWLARNGHVRVDPTVDLPRCKRARSVPRAQPPDAVSAVLDACRDDRDRAIIWMMVGLGLRRIEVARAAWEDYDPRARVLLVHGKGGHERILPVPAPVAHAMERVRVRGNTGPIIRSHTNPSCGIAPHTVGSIVVKLMQTAGVKHAPWDGVSGHALRHTAASDVLDQCGDLRVVQEMLGHAQLSTTSIYLRRANLGQMREAMEGREYLHAA